MKKIQVIYGYMFCLLGLIVLSELIIFVFPLDFKTILLSLISLFLLTIRVRPSLTQKDYPFAFELKAHFL